MFDELDKNIIRLIQNKKMCTPKINKIAKALRLPASTIHTRIKKLEQNGVINGYIGAVDPQKVDRGLTVFALLKLAYP